MRSVCSSICSLSFYLSLGLGLSEPGLSVGLSDIPQKIKKIAHKLRSGIDQALDTRENNLLQLYTKKQLPFPETVEHLLKIKINNPYIQALGTVQKMGKNLGLLSKTGKPESIRYEFYANQVPFCDIEVKAHYTDENSLPVLFGTLPKTTSEHFATLEQWPEFAQAVDVLNYEMEKRGSLRSDWKAFYAQKCFWIKNDAALPAWQIRIKDKQQLSYEITLDGDNVYKWKNLFFDLGKSGTVQAYERDPVTTELKTYTTDFAGSDGTLTSTFFRTDTDSGSDQTGNDDRAVAPDYAFTFKPSDIRFAEASVFIHATNMYSYYKTLGYSWTGASPLVLRLHVVFDGSNKNNALYQPGEANANGLPSISLGDGDGVLLQNLPIDADVVSHEFGHHTIFRTLKETIGESLVLHEGLADFFAFSHSGDPCLGPSICPTDSTACFVLDKCLRTASNTINYGDSKYVTYEAHLKGQVISGLLWDIRKTLGGDTTAKLVYHAIDYFVSNSGFRDFLISLMLSDNDQNKGKNACTIYDAAIARGFKTYISDLNCKKPGSLHKPSLTDDPSVDSGNNSGGGSSSSSSSGSHHSTPFGCGVVGSVSSSWSWWVLFLIPFLVI